MTIRRLLINFIVLVVMMLVIWYGGRYLSKIAGESYRNSIDENGIFIKAAVTGKKYHKGRYVVFEYYYKGKQFINREQNSNYYKNLIMGEIIEIKMDTTNPKDSYIFATGIK